MPRWIRRSTRISRCASRIWCVLACRPTKRARKRSAASAISRARDDVCTRRRANATRRSGIATCSGPCSADLRSARRQAWRAPGFTAIAIGTLALGLGATTAIFTLLERVVLRPLPFPQPEQLLSVSGLDSARRETFTVSSADWLDWRRSTALQSSALYSIPFRQGIVAGDSATRLSAVTATGGLFGVLGSRFVVGRPFTESDAKEGSPVVVVSERRVAADVRRGPDACGAAPHRRARVYDRRRRGERSGISGRCRRLVSHRRHAPAGSVARQHQLADDRATQAGRVNRSGLGGAHRRRARHPGARPNSASTITA